MIAKSILVITLLVASAPFGQAAPDDQPVRVVRNPNPQYPGQALNRGIGEGFAKIFFWVDEIGRASDFVVVAHNGEYFAESLLKSLRHWEFEPKIENGGPVGSVYSVEWRFRPEVPIELNVMQATERKFKKGDLMDEVKVIPISPEELDSPLALRAVHPLYVDAKAADRVVLDVEFFVDETGAVRLPRLLDDDDTDPQRQAALDVFRQWTFDLPTKNGDPALVSAQKQIVVPIVETPEAPQAIPR